MGLSPRLVTSHLENISADVFERYAPVITRFVDRRNGIYALYSGSEIYYVGLARNLRSRLRDHLRDRHTGLWDRFSVYLTRNDRFLKEMEALFLRISLPEGNRVKGRLPGSTDLLRDLQRNIQETQRLELHGLLGKKPRPSMANGSKAKEEDPFRNRTVFLRGAYKGREYRATWRRDGTVRFNGKLYTSLSAAATAITKRSTNGWDFWRARNAEGEWVKLSTMDRG